jgi:hypothetical protein
VTSWTAGGWSGSVGRLDHPIQQIAKRRQILDCNHNAGANYGLGFDRPVSKQPRGIWAHMCKRQKGEVAEDGHVELSITKKLRDIIRVCYRGLLRVIDHLSLLVVV